MQRRDFMLMLAAGTAAALASCSTRSDTTGSSSPTTDTPADSQSPAPGPTPSPTPSRSPLWLQDGPPSLPAPGELDTVITGLPENVGNTVAITVDDGADSSVVDAYLDFAKDSGVRLTFFVTASYPGWTDCKDR